MTHLSQTNKQVEVFVELLDEGIPTWRPTMAIPLGGSLFQILATPNYDPENEAWTFLPDTTIALEKKVFSDGKERFAARHPDPNVIRIDMPLVNNVVALTHTFAISLGKELYEILPTSHYNAAKETWQFPPGTIVKLGTEEIAGGFKIIVPIEKVDSV